MGAQLCHNKGNKNDYKINCNDILPPLIEANSCLFTLIDNQLLLLFYQ